MTAPLHLLHGWGFDARVMQPLARTLEESYRVRAHDVPGITTSWPMTMTLSESAKCLAGAVEPGAVVAGWSLGGNVAVQLAHEQPDRVAALILICCTPCFVVQPHWACGIDPGALTALRARLQEDAIAGLSKFASWCAMGERAVKKTRRTLLDYTLSARTSPSALACGLGLLQSLDQRELLAQIDCPVAMLFGGNDHLVPVVAADHCQSLSANIQVRVIEDCGHGLPVSLPSCVAEIVREFTAK